MSKPVVAKKSAHEPWRPADYEKADIYAIKALFAGRANEGQQQRALNWILFSLCGIRDLSFRPESDRATAFAEGKRFVGLQIAKLNDLRLADPMREPQENG